KGQPLIHRTSFLMCASDETLGRNMREFAVLASPPDTVRAARGSAPWTSGRNPGVEFRRREKSAGARRVFRGPAPLDGRFDGRAMALAQELTEAPKMSNHARGLWGYSGESIAGGALTIQSTGMGGPRAALVVADLHELGVRRAIRVGSCTALRAGLAPGTLLA